jgi:hypothetical protein
LGGKTRKYRGRQRARIKIIGRKSQIAFDKCLMRMPNMRVNLS